jgi:hypothetical protein
MNEKTSKFANGATVKFLDKIWEEKKRKAIPGGFFGPPIKEDCENKFTVAVGSVVNDETVEYILKEYPWLVWEEELELIV